MHLQEHYLYFDPRQQYWSCSDNYTHLKAFIHNYASFAASYWYFTVFMPDLPIWQPISYYELFLHQYSRICTQKPLFCRILASGGNIKGFHRIYKVIYHISSDLVKFAYSSLYFGCTRVTSHCPPIHLPCPHILNPTNYQANLAKTRSTP